MLARHPQPFVDALGGRVPAVHVEAKALEPGVRLDPPPEGRPTYAELAGEFALPVTQVTNHLFAVRRDFRRLVLDRLRAATGSEEEFRAEARDLLGGMPR